ncbi:MAG TPA: amidohydrolase family protein [Thermoanaerobacterales bacterium]|nr:amidohydrolase family protein [Thermoanaerobacterales bacterium]
MDLVIKNGNVVDFRARNMMQKNVGIKDQKIYLITDRDISGKKVIDANGKVVSPGFIDIHNHTDYNFKIGNKDPFETAKHMLIMGVTTSVGGNCGGGIVDIERYANLIKKQGAPNNYMGLIGHIELRNAVGNTDVYKTSTKLQIEKMKELLKKGLEKGAVGISFGLEYSPGATYEEVLEFCKVVKDYPNALGSVHFRYDGGRAIRGVNEIISLARDSGAYMQISHLNSGVCYGFTDEALKMIDNARGQGINVMADAYPYNAFSTDAGSPVFNDGCLENWNVGYDSILIATGEHVGKRCDKELFECVRENSPLTSFVAFVMNEEEVDKVLTYPNIIIASDGNINGGQGHPRAAGTFPRALHRYAAGKEEKDWIYILEKMTRLPAERLGLSSKGELVEGADADIVIFDQEKIKDNSTFEKPSLLPSGICYVLLNGEIAVKDNVIIKNDLGEFIERAEQ